MCLHGGVALSHFPLQEELSLDGCSLGPRKNTHGTGQSQTIRRSKFSQTYSLKWSHPEESRSDQLTLSVQQMHGMNNEHCFNELYFCSSVWGLFVTQG